ncbi:MAG: iron-sulfur cluster assembly accessory protein [Alphaproteobacteria bacterium]|nr:iron-sulfur cluster assembly accessory protein [Alphaproteobacteria bacterium]MCB9792014.1 iron-sulfur cluster assembly accessory protein [Alphaproteobacteria bacterium]
MAISLTDAALDRVIQLKNRRQTPEAFLRIGVRGGGCSGLSYVLDFVDEPQPKDKVFSFDRDVKVAVDRKSYLFVNGTEIDFVKSLMKTGFEFRNPLASGSCSCGDSFSI